MLISAIRGRTVFPQNARNPQKLLAAKGLPQIARIYTDVGGYGIPAIPTQPELFSHRSHRFSQIHWERGRFHRIHGIHRTDWQNNSPTDRTDFHRITGSVGGPTEFTEFTLSLQKKAIRLNNQGKTMIAKDSFVPLL